MKFTDQGIKALKPANNRIDIRENGNPGFAIRVAPSGRKSWLYIYTIDGVKRRMTLGVYPSTSLTKARAAYAEAVDKVRNGHDPAAMKVASRRKEKQAETIEQLAAEYMEKWAKPRKRSWAEDQRMLDKDVLPAWKNRKARSIERRDIILLLDQIIERGAPQTAIRIHALLHKMFAFAVGRDIVPFNPCAGIPKPAKTNQRDRVLSDDEIRTHWAGIQNSTMSPGSKLAILLQLTTAQRKGEILGARWDEIDGDVWTIPAEKAKNGMAHRVPLSPQAQALLADIKAEAGDSPYLFPSRVTAGHVTAESVDHALRRYLNGQNEPIRKGDAGWFTPHDLRRTAATRMTEIGVSRLVVSKVLNHAESGVTAIYDRHGYDKEKRQALETWGRRLDAIICGEKESSVIPIHKAF